MEYKEVLEQEQDYIAGVKKAIARRINELTKRQATTTNLIVVSSLINVFYGLKNAEAKDGCGLHIGRKKRLRKV